MKPKSLYIIFFVLGLFIGVFVGGALVTKQIEKFMVLTGLKDKSELTIVKPDSIKQETKNSKDVNNWNKSNVKNVQGSQITSVSPSNKDSVQKADSANTEVSDVMIKKDKLLSTSHITFQVASLEKRKKEMYLDSLLIDDRTQIKYQSQLIVEFWNSPINYKGYKMSKSKLVLFGLEPIDDVIVKQIENSVYLKYGNRIYRLNFTDDFMPFQAINNVKI